MENNIKLIKRNYLGKAFVHLFRNNETNEIFVEECTKEEYEALATASAENNPKKDGYTWIGSEGEVIKVDSPDILLKENEYTEIGDISFVVFRDDENQVRGKFVSGKIIQNDEISEVDLKNKKQRSSAKVVNSRRDQFEIEKEYGDSL